MFISFELFDQYLTLPRYKKNPAKSRFHQESHNNSISRVFSHLKRKLVDARIPEIRT